MNEPESVPAPEFSRPQVITPDMGADEDGRTFTIEADPEERAALARRFGLLSLDSLTAEGRVEVFARARKARVSATLHADVVQACVATLVPVASHIDESFSRAFDRKARIDAEDAEFTLESRDPPDPLPEEGIDLGELVAEQLGLALDPYPRAPGAAAPPVEAGEADPPRESPFSALKRLKDR